MKDATLIKTGVIGTVIAAICCFTPFLVIGLGVVGLSAWLGWLDYVLLPTLAAFVGITVYGFWRRQRAAACCETDPEARRRPGDMADCCTPPSGGRYDLAVIGAGSAGFPMTRTSLLGRELINGVGE